MFHVKRHEAIVFPWNLIHLGHRGTVRSVAPWIALCAVWAIGGIVVALPVRLAEPQQVLVERLSLVRATAAAGLAWACVMAWPIRPPISLQRNLGSVPLSGFSINTWTSLGRLLACLMVGVVFLLGLWLITTFSKQTESGASFASGGPGLRTWSESAMMLSLLCLLGAVGIAGDLTFGRAGATVAILAGAGLPMFDCRPVRLLLTLGQGEAVSPALLLTRLTLAALLILTTAWLSEYLPAGYPSLQETPKKLRKSDQ